MSIKQQILTSPEGGCLNGKTYLLDNIDFIAEEIKDIQGDIVECGVWKGATFAYMANIFPNRTMWAYDSFDGVPYNAEQTKYPDKYNVLWALDTRLKSDISTFYETLHKYGIEKTDNINVITGWFKDTLPSANYNIALLRVDGDLYSSTYEVLEYLYPNVVEGGFVIFDDYCIDESRNAVWDYFCDIQELPTFYDIWDNKLTQHTDLYINPDISHNLDSIRKVQGVFIKK